MTDGSVLRPWEGVVSPAADWTVTVVEPESPLDHAALDPTSLRDATDGELVGACRAGRKEAFDIIVERHRRAVYHLCYRFVGNHEDASDLAQDTFVKAWRGLHGFKGESALATWLYRIAVNTCLNRVQAKSLPTEALEGDQFVDTTIDDPSAGLLRDERAQAVREAIARLPDRQRATLILRSYQGLSHREIAEVLGSSVGAVKANFFHALANLKKILGREP
jgi:RNA polymerase sigma-70 factor (ECF subfamily)